MVFQFEKDLLGGKKIQKYKMIKLGSQRLSSLKLLKEGRGADVPLFETIKTNAGTEKNELKQ